MLVFYKEIKRHPPNCCLLEVKLDEINIRVMLTCISMSKIYFNISKWFEFVVFFLMCVEGFRMQLMFFLFSSLMPNIKSES